MYHHPDAWKPKKKAKRIPDVQHPRLRLSNGQYPTDKEKLYELQNGLCWLCWQPIDLKAHGERRASIDHYIPRSKGGKNTWANKLLAHADCNSKRSDKKAQMSRDLALSLLQYTDELQQ